MLLAAALVPQTALLVPGAAGRAEALATERRVVLTAVADLVAAGPDRVVVVVPGAERRVTGRLRPTLAAAGLDDDRLDWPVPVLGVTSPGPRPPAPDRPEPGGTHAGPAETRVDDVAAAVGLHLLAQVGWPGPVSILGVTARTGLVDEGRALVAGRERVALLLCASLSARRGPGAPLAEDDRAPAVDDAVLADLAGLGGSPEEAGAAWTRLAELPLELASALAVSAWAPWQVLLGALGTSGAVLPVRAEVRLVTAPFGATYAVALWRRLGQD